MSSKNICNDKSEVDDKISALFTNAAAVRAVAEAVENTLGPKGLDTMLVDQAGNIIVTNAGVTILDSMEVTHPAARMLINIARNQYRQSGDGTTTATVVAAALINEGLNYVIRGVPVGKIIKGIDIGITEALKLIDKKKIELTGTDDPLLKCAVFTAGRENEEITNSITSLAKSIGIDVLKNKNFKLSDHIFCQTGMNSEVIEGLAIKKRRINEQMPEICRNAKILVIDDSLIPEEITDSAMKTESGFNAYTEYRRTFNKNLQKILSLDIKVVITSKTLDRYAEEVFTSNSIMAFSRIYGKDLRDIIEFTGATPVRRTILEKSIDEIENYLGYAEEISENIEYGHVYFKGGKGKPISTYIVGAPSEEISGEKERIARDAASSLQSSLRNGVVAGGGALEISLIPYLRDKRDETGDLFGYGIDCVIEALKRPMSQIVSNAGFNSLEKIEQVLAMQKKNQGDWGIECDNGEIKDMKKEGIIDPAEVKMNALKSAGEIARAILKINTIIKMRPITE